MDTLKPTKSIVIYKSSSENYAEVHNIKNGEFLEGRPLVKGELEDLVKIAKSNKNLEDNDSIDLNPFRLILSYKSNPISDTIVWIYPAQQQKLIYSEGMETKDYWIPNIIFKSDGKAVYVYAIKSNDILSLNEGTQLYNAPFFNIYEKGSVCMGQVKIKKFKDVNDIIKNVEAAFFMSEFTHTNFNEIVKGSLLDAYNNQNGKFDESLLIPCKKLNEIC